LLDGRLNICNNCAEHLAKSFALCRKNFLFSNTPRGSEASAIVMSIIETAKLNKIDVFKYLTYILETAPKLDMTKKEDIEKGGADKNRDSRLTLTKANIVSGALCQSCFQTEEALHTTPVAVSASRQALYADSSALAKYHRPYCALITNTVS